MATILIVEDEIHIQKLAKFVLEKAGHRVDIVSSGEEAFKYIATNRPDLILLDIMMPGIDGLGVLRRLKSLPATKSITIILLTSLAHEAVVLKGISLGAAEFIRKPFHPTELVKRLSKFLPPTADESQS